MACISGLWHILRGMTRELIFDLKNYTSRVTGIGYKNLLLHAFSLSGG